MTGGAWQLPTSAVIGGKPYELHTDYRDILDIIRTLNDRESPEFVRWHVALALFYEGEISCEDTQEAMEYLAGFISCGQQQTGKAPPKLLDWDQDALAIVADVNRVAGCEIRALPYLHWWTFMSYFAEIGEGQLSTLVSIRDKLHKGKPLEKWEREWMAENKDRVQLREKYTAEEQAEIDRLNALLQ